MADGKGRGDFFAVDRISWGAVLRLGLNASVAYLVIARGTGRDNRTTSWSVNAVEKHTAISRHRARAAVDSLIQAGLMRLKDSGSRPRYDMGAANSKKPDWIWLPNTLVDGVTGNAVPPLEMVRQTQDIAALKLLVELYGAHELAANGGVSWLNLRRDYDRKKVAERGGYVIWAFWPSDLRTADRAKLPASAFMLGKREKNGDRSRDAGWSVFWAALKTLEILGFLEFVPYLVESAGAEAEIIMPLHHQSGTHAERHTAASAMEAAARLLGPDGDAIVEREGGMVIPLRPHQAQVQAVGICRLRFRPHTAATAAWMARTEEWEQMALNFNAIAPASKLRIAM